MFSFNCRVVRVVECSGFKAWARGHRVLSRRPVRVHIKGPEKEEQDIIRQYEEATKRAAGKGSQQNDKHSKQDVKLPSAPDPRATIRNSIKHKLLSEARDYERNLLGNVKNTKFRNEHQLFVAEGHRIIKEALEHDVTPEAIYFTRLKLVAALKSESSDLELEDVKALSDLPLYRAPYKNLQTWSTVTTSPGIVGVFKIPKSTNTPCKDQSHTPPITLVLDELREPGNLGGILRTAAAVGVHQVLLMKGCCDPWEAKVVRAGCGAHFRLRLVHKVTWDLISNHIPNGAPVFVADMCHGEEEQHAPPAHTLQEDGGNEDLNKIYEMDSYGNKVVIDQSYNDLEHLEQYQRVHLPTVRYDQLRLSGEEGAVLVIGGELGVSNAARKFVSLNYGSKLSVPLANGMESLNVGVAFGVILYEMQKHLHDVAIQMPQKSF